MLDLRLHLQEAMLQRVLGEAMWWLTVASSDAGTMVEGRIVVQLPSCDSIVT